jgi:hypothetical protein
MKKQCFALAAAILISTVLSGAVSTVSFQSNGGYDPWVDLNDDGTIDIFDIVQVALLFGSSGTPFLEKAALIYDSGWVNCAEHQGDAFNVTHNLNIADWNTPNLVVEIIGQTAPNATITHRQLGLTSQSHWTRTYGGISSEQAWAAIQTADGGYVLAGNIWTPGCVTGPCATGHDMCFVKTDPDGVIEFVKQFGGADEEDATSVVQTSDGGYALAGYTSSYGAGSLDFWLVKIDSSGAFEWNQTYGGIGVEVAYSMVQTSDGGYALAGYTESFGAGTQDIWLVRTDKMGNMLWNQTYGGPDPEQGRSLVQTSDKGYAVAGYTHSFGPGLVAGWLVKTYANGTAAWTQTYGGGSAEATHSVVQTADGGYALAGITTSYGAGGGDFWLVKTDSSGVAEWNQTYGGSIGDTAQSLVQTSDGGYALAGWTDSFGAGLNDVWLVKTYANGTLAWTQTYGGPLMDIARAVVQTSDGGYAIAGSTDSFSFEAPDLWLIKTGVESGLIWKGCTPDTVTLYRGATDLAWNYVRVRIWETQEAP